jgi:hypothetical protein
MSTLIFIEIVSILVTVGHIQVTDLIYKKSPEINLTVEKILTPVITTSAPGDYPIQDVPMPDIIPAGIIYPRPTNIPLLREYKINKDTGTEIWYAQKPESYIVPDNEWVKYVASQLYIDDIGIIRYKNMPIPFYRDHKGNILAWTDEPFSNNYFSDDELFDFPANADLWQNADYYLSHGMKGDCEDWAIAITSMMLSGHMSIKENGTYIRQVITAKTVIGYSGKSIDAWTEYNVHNKKYLSSTGRYGQDGGEYISITTFHHESDWKGQFEPIYQFTNKSFGKYRHDI